MSELESRVAKLEKTNRLLRIVVLLSVICFASIAAKPTSLNNDLIVAKNFQLEDPQGELVGLWTTDKSGQPNLLLQSADKKRGILLKIGKNEPSEIHIRDTGGWFLIGDGKRRFTVLVDENGCWYRRYATTKRQS